jgi:hypothetical protein
MHVIISRIQFFSIYGIIHICGEKHSNITCNYVYSHAMHSYCIHIYMLMLLGPWIWIVGLCICIFDSQGLRLRYGGCVRV